MKVAIIGSRGLNIEISKNICRITSLKSSPAVQKGSIHLQKNTHSPMVSH